MRQPSGRPFEILIVEDDKGDLMLVHEALDGHEIPCNLRAVSDGAAAIEVIEELERAPEPRLDLVIIDLHLPKLDGTAILERLRKTAHLRATPAIVMSGLAADRIHSMTAMYELVHPFSKPADLQGFLALGLLVAEVLMLKMRVRTERPVRKNKEMMA